MKKVALISDIHSNYDALKTVLEEANTLGVDTTICLGDIVGYGPNPQECLDLLRTHNVLSIMGNHDAGVTNAVSLRHFPTPTRNVITWTQQVLSRENIEYLQDLPQTREFPGGIIVHASPRDPFWHGISDTSTATLTFRLSKHPVICIGHTHIPGAFFFDKWQAKIIPVRMSNSSAGFSLELKADTRYLINPGSVGQPRDGDVRASFAILDIEGDRVTSVTWHRVRYQPEVTRQDVLKNKLPIIFGNRLLEAK